MGPLARVLFGECFRSRSQSQANQLGIKHLGSFTGAPPFTQPLPCRPETRSDFPPSLDYPSGFVRGTHDRQSSTTSVSPQEEEDEIHAYHCAKVDEYENELFRRLAGGKLYNATLEEAPKTILCAGNGTSAWAMEMSRKYPSALITILEPNPFARLAPENCQFEKANIETYNPGSIRFDYIYVRNVRHIRNWLDFLLRLKVLLAPGGMVELFDIEARGYTLCTCETPVQWHGEPDCVVCNEFPPSADRGRWMERAGFSEVAAHRPNHALRNRDGRNMYCESVTGQLKEAPPQILYNSRHNPRRSWKDIVRSYGL